MPAQHAAHQERRSDITRAETATTRERDGEITGGECHPGGPARSKRVPTASSLTISAQKSAATDVHVGQTSVRGNRCTRTSTASSRTPTVAKTIAVAVVINRR